MTNYPVMFTFQDAVSGNGFLSGITVRGRAIMTQEDGKWWMYGFHPGGIADFGDSVMEAYSKFHEAYKSVLFDIAEESANFDAFKREVERFYWECGTDDGARWDDALKALRSGEIKPEEPLAKLPRLTPEQQPCNVEITRLDCVDSKQFSSKDNVSDELALPIAA
jgi:hypothetical protein